MTQWRAAAAQEPDLLLWRMASAQPVLALLVCALALCLIVFAILYLRRALVAEPRPRRNAAAFLGFSIVTLLLASAALLKAGTYDPAYQMREFSPLCSFIRDNIKPSEILIVQPYPGPAWQYLMNAECGQRAWYSLPYNDQPGSGTQTPQVAHDLIVRAVPAGARYWLLQQFWSDSYDATATSLAPGSDPRLHEQIFYSPFHMYIAAYTRTQQP